MLRRLFTLLLAALALWPAPVQAAKSYTAERYDVRVAIQPDGALLVTESIVFRFEGGPFTYVFRDLAVRELDQIDQIEASLDGRVLPAGPDPGQAEIQAGRSVRVTWHFAPVSDAAHTFTLTYRVSGAIRQLEADTLIWRAIPEEHAYEIASATLVLVPPAGVAPLGAPSLNRPAAAQPDGLAWTLAGGLAEDEDLVITARFPAGSLITAAPEWQRRAEARAAAIRGALPFAAVAGLGTLLLGGLGLWAYARANRRELDLGPQPAQATLPAQVPPALVGKLTGQPHANLGAIFDLARRGRLMIRETPGWFGSKQHRLELLPGAEPLRPHEAGLLAAIFKAGETTAPLSEVGTRLAGQAARFDEPLQQELVELGWLDRERQRQRTRLNVVWGLALLLGAGLALGSVILGGALLEDAPAGVIWAAGLAGLGAGVCGLSIAGLIYAAAFSPLTPAGEEQAARWRGFQAYLKDVTRGREPATRADFFERYLPYAAVFGLGAAWARTFQTLGGVPLPAWFQALPGSAGDFGAIIAVMAASDSTGASAGGAGAAGASGGGASGAG